MSNPRLKEGQKPIMGEWTIGETTLRIAIFKGESMIEVQDGDKTISVPLDDMQTDQIRNMFYEEYRWRKVWSRKQFRQDKSLANQVFKALKEQGKSFEDVCGVSDDDVRGI